MASSSVLTALLEDNIKLGFEALIHYYTCLWLVYQVFFMQSINVHVFPWSYAVLGIVVEN